MTLKSRVEKLESVDTDQSTETGEYQRRWADAFAKLAGTMRPEHFAVVHDGLIRHFENAPLPHVWEYAPSFLAARALHLVTRAAQDFHSVLALPPEVVEVWAAYEREIGEGATASERYAAHHAIVECADCGAEYPQLRPRRWSREQRAFVGASRDYVDACLLCGGRVGFNFYSNQQSRLAQCSGTQAA